MIGTGPDHLLGAHRYLAAPVQHEGEPPAELEVPPRSAELARSGRRGRAEYGSRCRREGPLASLGYVTKGELCREQALVFGAVAPRTR